MISCDFPPPSHYSHYSHYGDDDLQAGPPHRSPLGGHIGRITQLGTSAESETQAPPMPQLTRQGEPGI